MSMINRTGAMEGSATVIASSTCDPTGKAMRAKGVA
jgi:hypothetical protein